MKNFVFIIKDCGVQEIQAENSTIAIEIAKKHFGNNIIVAWDSNTGIDII